MFEEWTFWATQHGSPPICPNSESNSQITTNSIFQHLGMCYEILSGHFKHVHVLAGLAQARRRLGLAVCELAVFPWYPWGEEPKYPQMKYKQTSWNFILKCMCHVRRATSTSDLPSCAITDLTKCDVIVAVEMLYERRFSAEVRSSNASCADQLVLLIAKVHSIPYRSDLHSHYIVCSALSTLVCAHIWPPFPPGDRAQY
ncbi:hypothetical protein EDD22DRAFT_333500 [Suillus occidentalis]|nr:hypothetical protein EDD22DRAFT_333500 [Suillus occidentalis]